MKDVKLYNATIEHRHGTNFYTAQSEEELQKEVAEYCREWWGDEMEGQEMPDNDADVISLYFHSEHGANNESITYGESIIDESWLPTPFKQLTEEEAREKCELVYLEMESGFHIALDATYLDQVGEFWIKLPTGEVIDSRKIK